MAQQQANGYSYTDRGQMDPQQTEAGEDKQPGGLLSLLSKKHTPERLVAESFVLYFAFVGLIVATLAIVVGIISGVFF